MNIALKALQNVLSSISMNDGIVEPEFAVALLKVSSQNSFVSFVNTVSCLHEDKILSRRLG